VGGRECVFAERLINHAAAVQTDVEAIYDRWHYILQMEKAVEAFEQHFRSLLKKAAIHPRCSRRETIRASDQLALIFLESIAACG
jgi:hypothetical protein